MRLLQIISRHIGIEVITKES